MSPVDFLNLIRGAKYIVTDSFHGSVFSILNHKSFLTVNRYSDSLRKSKKTLGLIVCFLYWALRIGIILVSH